MTVRCAQIRTVLNVCISPQIRHTNCVQIRYTDFRYTNQILDTQI